MKPLFIAAGSQEWGSSRMRSWWIAPHIRGASVITFEARSPGFKSLQDLTHVIWQKNVDLDILENRRDVKHYWDVCDPAWWWQPERCREIANNVNGVVASSQNLAADFNQWYGKDKAICIADRIDLDKFPYVRHHSDVTPVRFIWFGVAVNRIAIFGQLVNLERLAANGYKIELTIFDDHPDEELLITNSFPVYHKRWSLGSESDVLPAHNIALLPNYPGAWGRVKSNNKQLTAWVCGLPVVSDESYYEIKDLVSDSIMRQNKSTDNTMELKKNWLIEKSVAEWEKLLCAS